MYIRATSHILNSWQYFWIWTLVIIGHQEHPQLKIHTSCKHFIYSQYRAVNTTSLTLIWVVYKETRLENLIQSILCWQNHHPTPFPTFWTFWSSKYFNGPRIATWGICSGDSPLNMLNIEYFELDSTGPRIANGQYLKCLQGLQWRVSIVTLCE